jgi:hypothetical protein
MASARSEHIKKAMDMCKDLHDHLSITPEEEGEEGMDTGEEKEEGGSLQSGGDEGTPGKPSYDEPKSEKGGSERARALVAILLKRGKTPSGRKSDETED